MRCKFANRDLIQRLDSSICRYRGRAVFVRYGGAEDLMNIWYLPSSRKGAADETIHANNEQFDISTVPLGYMQEGKDVVNYACRRPGRIYKQGVSYDNLHFYQINGKGVMSNPSIYDQGFKDMVEDNYPSLKEVMASIRKSTTKKEVAISRDIALQWDPTLRLIYVYYKTDQVGFIIDGSNTVIVPSSEKAWVVSKFLSLLSWEVQ